MRKTRIGPYFHRIISAHDIGLPKEDVRFWTALRNHISYDPQRTLLGEDSETNLETARRSGIRELIYISGSSSAITPVASPRFTSVRHFGELFPH
jgi:putative hydrolase of the HAD superfamily